MTGGDAAWRPPRVRTLVGLAAASLALGALFRLVPAIDLWVSDLFYAPGRGFFLGHDGLPVAVYRAVNVLQIVAIAGLIAVGLVWAWRRRPPLGLSSRAIVMVAGTLAIGSGLLVNAVFKDHWGRARPAQVERYGGTLAFTPPAVIARQCGRNCSFPAGHPALIFAGFGLALALAGRRRRRRAVVAVAALGAAVGLGRIVQGAHFLSDVLFSGLLCYAVAAALAHAVARWPVPHAIDARALRARAAAAWRGAVDAAGAGGRATIEAARASPLWTTSLAVLAVIAVSVAAVDQPLALWLKGFDATPPVDVLRSITWLGRAPGWLVMFGLVAAGLWWASRAAWNAAGRARLERAALQAGFLFAAVALPSLVSSLAKAVLGRARPRLFFWDGDYGFAPLSLGASHNSMPSGHAIVAAGLATGVALLWPRLWPVSLVFALTIAVSRVAITVHYLGDVVAGLWLGAFTVLGLAMLSRHWGLDIVAVRFDRRGRPRRAAASDRH